MPKPKRNIQAVAEETLTPPDSLTATQQIARVKAAAGNSLYNVELPSGEPILAELPSRFRNTIWIKRGNFVLVDSLSLAERGNKLGGEIVNIVRDEKAWRKKEFWPKEFGAERQVTYPVDSDDDADERPLYPPSDDES